MRTEARDGGDGTTTAEEVEPTNVAGEASNRADAAEDDRDTGAGDPVGHPVAAGDDVLAHIRRIAGE